MPNLRGSEWLIIVLLLVLLFGAKRLPDAARGVGRSLRIFKSEARGLVEDEVTPTVAPSAGAAPQVSPAPPAGQPGEAGQATKATSPHPPAQA